MAKKDTKTKELRVRLPEQHHAILEEYCEVYGQTPSSTICGYIVEVLWQALARTREVVVKFNNFTPNNSPVSQIVEKSSLKKTPTSSKKKKAKPLPEDFDPPREISEAHGLDHESGGRVHGLGVIQGTYLCRLGSLLQERMSRMVG